VRKLTIKVKHYNDRAKVVNLITTLDNNKKETNVLLDTLKKDENKVSKIQKQLIDQNKIIQDSKTWVSNHLLNLYNHSYIQPQNVTQTLLQSKTNKNSNRNWKPTTA